MEALTETLRATVDLAKVGIPMIINNEIRPKCQTRNAGIVGKMAILGPTVGKDRIIARIERSHILVGQTSVHKERKLLQSTVSRSA